MEKYVNTFSRNLIIAVQSILYEQFFVYDQSNKKLKIPTYYSFNTNNLNFVRNFLTNEHKYYNELSKIEGNISNIPRCVFKLNFDQILSDNIGGGFTRLKHTELIDNGFGKQMVDKISIGNLTPVQYSGELLFTLSTEEEKLFVLDQLVDNIYKIKRLYFDSEGFHKIPLVISFEESISVNRIEEITKDTKKSEKDSKITWQFKAITLKPCIYEETTVDYNRVVKPGNNNLNIKF